MNIQEIYGRLSQSHASSLVALQTESLDPWIEIRPEGLLDVCRTLKNESDLSFDYLHCITAVDYLETDPKKLAQTAWQPHIELIYHLSSMQHRHKLVLKTKLPRFKEGTVGELPEIASVAGVWKTADWHEREEYDLVGIRFVGHPDFRRILCPEDWVGHPLRKDYVMSEEYHGVPAK